MTASHVDIDLPRFSRFLGVAGLASADEPSESPPIGLVRPFAGILDTGVRLDRIGGPMPALSYLTLAPLLARAIAGRRTQGQERSPESRDTRSVEGRGPNRSVLDPSGPGGDENETADDERDTAEQTVREVLQESGREPGGSTTRSDVGGMGENLSTVTTFDRTVRRLADRHRPEAAVGSPSRLGASGWAAATGDEGSEPTGPQRTVLDRGERRSGADETTGTESDAGEPTVRSVLRATDDMSTATSGTEEAARPHADEGAGTGSGEQATPTGQPHRSPAASTETDEGDGSRSRGSDRRGGTMTGGSDLLDGVTETTFTGPSTSPRMTVVEERAGSEDDPTVDGRGRSPERATVQRSESESYDAREVGQSPSTGPSGSDEKRRETTETPSVFAPDGRVNDRVLDRLYEELRRKERIERDREGR
ncbi:hypothetical protein [Halobellus litoreus]|uniref:Uncharacterized protein n=1 Tax=Halobellus litoreus TaxID=755310 RepID=A0ABD6DXR3_9EURY|nr:hypothetical protein [Halobellus litoreus]